MGPSAGTEEDAAKDRESQTLRVRGADGMELRVVLAGQGPLLLLPTPGWGPSLELYERTLRPLERAFTVAYVDTRGTGASTQPKLGVLWGLERFAADLDRVRDELGRNRCYVLGHGSGAAMALAYAMTYGEACSGLVLVAATASRDEQWRQRMTERVKQRMQEDAAFAERVVVMHQLSQGGAPESDADARAYLLASLPTMFAEPEAFARHRAAFEAMQVRAQARQFWESAAGRFDFSRMLDLVRCPVLVINGAEDHIAAPVDARLLAERIEGAEMAVVPEAGHFPWLEQPAAFYPRIERWLAAQR